MKQFREEVRSWLADNCPESARGRGEPVTIGSKRPMKNPELLEWRHKLGERGWTIPTWPKEYGGGGLSAEESKVLAEEMSAIKTHSPLYSFGISMLGPALLEYATEEQKREHLPRIASGEIRWCQGYSEPAAGSDLASLATKCEDKGDHYLVNGQKVWTSYADKADWIFCLVRTDNSGTKHQGISFLLFDMESEGVEARPIKLISGRSPFCETFFENVQVPKENLVGKEGEGWNIAKYLLTHEREMIGDMEAPRPISEVAAQSLGLVDGKLADSLLRGKVVEAEIDDWAFKLTVARMLSEAKAGVSLGAKSSMMKYYGTELNKRRLELLMDAAGQDGLEWESDRSDDGHLARGWLRTKGNSIEGGTSEVQLNIISKHILQLPGA